MQIPSIIFSNSDYGAIRGMSEVSFFGYVNINHFEKQNIVLSKLSTTGSTAVITQNSSDLPLSISEVPVISSSNPTRRPLVSSALSAKVVATVANPGETVVFDLSNKTFSNESTIRFTLKTPVGTTTITSLVFESTTSSDTITWSNIPVKGGVWQHLCLEISKGTVTGTINYSDIKTAKITMSTIGVYEFYDLVEADYYNLMSCSAFHVDFHCKNSFEMEFEVDKEEALCNGDVRSKNVTTSNFGINIKSDTNNIYHQSISYGTLMSKIKMFNFDYVNGSGSKKQTTIANNQLTLPYDQMITDTQIIVSIGSTAYVYTPTNKDLYSNQFTFSQDATTKTITFTFGEGADGSIPSIRITRVDSLTGFSIQPSLSMIGSTVWQTKRSDGVNADVQNIDKSQYTFKSRQEEGKGTSEVQIDAYVTADPVTGLGRYGAIAVKPLI